MRARIVIGGNYGDEGKGTVVASYTNRCDGRVLNVLTNGGAQRGHSVLTEDGNVTSQHFGSGTYFGADNFYSRYFILNPMQFVREYESLIVKPENIFRDAGCRWSTPYDVMANHITEEQLGRHASCRMGIWNTVKRYRETETMTLDEFVACEDPFSYLVRVRDYYEASISIPNEWRDIWRSATLMQHFLNDCLYMSEVTKVGSIGSMEYDEVIFENGQGLLLCDTGKDTYDTTPSNTGILYSLELLKDIPDVDVTAHYVTRPYLTRHGDGHIMNQQNMKDLSKHVLPDRNNFFNNSQGEFRHGTLDIPSLRERIVSDSNGVGFELEVTHCDEMDRVSEFKKLFDKVNTYDSPLVK
jgi:adenylosuccinate synthase